MKAEGVETMQIIRITQSRHLQIPTIVKLANQKVQVISVERTKIMNFSHLKVKLDRVGSSLLIS